MRRRLLLATATALLLLPAALPAQTVMQGGPALAPVPAAPNPTAAAAPPRVTRPVDDRVAFDSAEQWLIPRYFEHVRELQKRAARSKRYDRALPAGMTQAPAKGDQIAPAMLAQMNRLPGPLLRDLPPARPGTDRVIAGKNVLMVSLADGQVLDIISNVIY